ncbi:MAG: HPr(Ser) kinase/phosphatase, partial [Candidatus Latescibacteria bacterium]|nr:HPr(Ser) kinase/phosphatase [Candidatus Latescibacterota bacterium]
MNQISVGEAFDAYGEHMALELLAGQGGLGNVLTTSDAHRPGLALAGFV